MNPQIVEQIHAAPLFSDDESAAASDHAPEPARPQPLAQLQLQADAELLGHAETDTCAGSSSLVEGSVAPTATGHTVAQCGGTQNPEAAFGDGMGRALRAMQLFEDAKKDYATAETDTGGGALPCTHAKVAAQCRDLSKDHGGVYIKAAQFVASLPRGTANAAVPVEFITAFASLTDRAPEIPFEYACRVIVQELGADTVRERIGSVSTQPLAAGSLAQVHWATLLTTDSGAVQRSTQVALKVQRPGLAAQVQSDFETFEMFGSMIQPGGKDLSWLVADIKQNLASELDFRIEAQNCERVRSALLGRADAVVPAVVPGLSTARVLGLEYIEDLKRLDDLDGLWAAGLSPAAVGMVTADVFAELALKHGLVHGDPHSGNVYALAGTTSAPQGRVVVLDHGLYHGLASTDRCLLARLILSCAHPWPDVGLCSRLATEFTGAGEDHAHAAQLLPLLVSPAFALATGLSVATLSSAADGVLPDTVSLDEVWDLLVTMRGRGAGLLGLMHSFGYLRGLLNTLRFPERQWAHVLVRQATATVGGGVWAQRAGWVRVETLFVLLWVVAAAFRVCAFISRFLPHLRTTKDAR